MINLAYEYKSILYQCAMITFVNGNTNKKYGNIRINKIKNERHDPYDI